MIKLQTPVEETPCRVEISYGDKILLLGSCFADSLGKTLTDYGFDTLVNPFGTLYNPASICLSVRRLISGKEFTLADCVPMGGLPKGKALKDDATSGGAAENTPQRNDTVGNGVTGIEATDAEKICSFSHHTSFARPDEAAFLENANASLHRASAFFRECNKVIITLGTAWCFRYIGSSSRIDPYNAGRIVSNCLKRDPKEFSREMLSLKDCTALLRNIVTLCGSFGPDEDDGEASGRKTGFHARRKEIIFTVSPIRHLADGAHGNQLSKSALLMAINEVCPETTVINHRPVTKNRPAILTGSLKTDISVSTTGNSEIACGGGIDYFPAYEIMMDELRDYRFYAEDMIHPSAQAVAYIAERFFARHLSPADRPLLQERIRIFKRSLHRPMTYGRDPRSDGAL